MGEARFTVFAMKSVDPESRNSPTTVGKKPIYTVFPFAFEGESELSGLVNVFEKLYREPLLHQVSKFDSAPISGKSSRDKTVLYTKMTVEVLLVNDAEKRDPETDLKPKFSEKGTDKSPVMLATTGRNYQTIAKKNIFAPPAPARSPDIGEDTVIETGETPDQVLPAVLLTQIIYSDYYGIWTARINNQGNKGDSALLADGPLPANSRFMQLQTRLDKQVAGMQKAEDTLRKGKLSSKLTQELEEQVRQGQAAENELARLEKPVSRWSVKDRFKVTHLDMQIVRIDPLQIIFQAKGQLRVLKLDSSLHEALAAKPLDEAKIKELGLGGKSDAILSKVELKKIEFSTARKDRQGAYEGTFVNPENKDEKMVLATEFLPEELDAPETWKVKDRFGTVLVDLKVVNLDKERVIFLANKHYYTIKAGGNLHAAMEKPLAEAEMKELKLEAP